MRFVMVPGIGNSDSGQRTADSGHWQSIWQTSWGDDADRDSHSFAAVASTFIASFTSSTT